MSPGGKENEATPPPPPVSTNGPGIPNVAGLRQFLQDARVYLHEAVTDVASLQNMLRAQLLSRVATEQLTLWGAATSSQAPGGARVARVNAIGGPAAPPPYNNDETVYLPLGGPDRAP